MINAHRFRTLAGVCLLAGVSAVIYCGSQFFRQAGIVRRLTDDVAACAAISHEIIRLRGRPTKVVVKQIDPLSFAQHVEGSAVDQGFRREQIVAIDPGSPSRIGDSPYWMRLTSVDVHDVTLSELLGWLEIVIEDNPGIYLWSMRARSPRVASIDSEKERWDVDVKLVDFEYRPN